MTPPAPCYQPGHKPDPAGRPGHVKVLLVVGDGAEVLDTLVPLYRLGEEYQVVVAGPEKRAYHLVIHERSAEWDITEERPGYRLETDAAFRDIRPDDYTGLVLPGGRAPEYLRYDSHLLGIVRSFFDRRRPVASICHGIEILGAAGVLNDREVTTIPKCRFDAEVCGAHYREEPVVRCGHLICARGKKDMSGWMKQFVQMLRESE
jgi:protease I